MGGRKLSSATTNFVFITDKPRVGGYGGIDAFGASIDMLKGRLAGLGICVDDKRVTVSHSASSDTQQNELLDFLECADLVWLFGFGQGAPSLSKAVVTRLTDFMNQGGGVFATGDHECMGRALVGDLPRVRHMRMGWLAGPPACGGPSSRLDDRINTVVQDDHPGHSSGRESDSIPKRILPTFQWCPQCGTQRPHALVASSGDGAILHLPDHVHEGVCLETATAFEDFGSKTVSFEVGALSLVCAGAGTDASTLIRKARLSPTVAAYSHEAYGRIVVDSTIHHWLTKNLDAFKCTRHMSEFARYFGNIALWLLRKRRTAPQACQLLNLAVLSSQFQHPMIAEMSQEAEPLLGGLVMEMLALVLSECWAHQVVDDVIYSSAEASDQLLIRNLARAANDRERAGATRALRRGLRTGVVGAAAKRYWNGETDTAAVVARATSQFLGSARHCSPELFSETAARL